MKKNTVYEAEVTDMNNLGYGIAKIDGKTVFVSGGVTGDSLRVKVIKDAKDYAVAITEDILSPSGKRIESDCDVSEKCGGCSFRHIKREYELELKRSFVTASFRKNRIEAEVMPVVTDGVTEGYRNKVQYPVGADGVYGYYAKHSHRIVPCDDCRLADRRIDSVARYAAQYLRTNGFYRVRHIYVRCGQKTGQIMLCIVSGLNGMKNEREFVGAVTERFSDVVSIVWNCQPADTNVILGDSVRVLYGKDSIEDELCGCRFSISSRAFYQVNRGMAELLYREAHRRAAVSSPSFAADLYCGTGTVGITLAASYPGIRVRGVEIVPSAVENARYNAELNGISTAEFVCADALTADLNGIDCVIVDPPRKGLSRELVTRLCGKSRELNAGRIVYISCNPETLARDAALLISAGYKMNGIVPFDLFPRTGAVECVTDFSR